MWTVKVLKKKTKLNYSCVWMHFLGLSIRCYPSPQLDYLWIILFGSGAVSFLRDLPDKFEKDLKTQFRSNFLCQLIFTRFYATTWLRSIPSSCCQKMKNFFEMSTVYKYLYVWNKNMAWQVNGEYQLETKRNWSVLIKIVSPTNICQVQFTEWAHYAADSCSKWMNNSRSTCLG